MHIQTITSAENDSEICVSCPTCGASEYYDPRPWRCCECCMAARASDFIRRCPKCGESTATGDTEWLLVCEPVEKAVWDSIKDLEFDELMEQVRKVIRK